MYFTFSNWHRNLWGGRNARGEKMKKKTPKSHDNEYDLDIYI